MIRYKPINETIEQTKTSAFKKWFGNSKVVKGGKPLVVYHGSNTSFKSFEQDRIGSYTGNFGHYGHGFYFSYDPREAKTYGNNIFPVYVKMEKPFYGDDEKYLDKYAKYFGYDNKIPIRFDISWLLNALKKKDIVAYELANLIIKYDYSQGWSRFKNKFNMQDSILDLNDVSEWANYSKSTNNEELPEMIIDEVTEILGKPKVILDYPFSDRPQMKYMTDLGSSQAKRLTDQIKKDGYDGVIAGSELVVFHPNQIKSAIGNNGNFDSKSNNILEAK